MANKEELRLLAMNHPERFDLMDHMEKEVAAVSKHGASSFFPADTTSKKYRRQYDKNSDSYYSIAMDVRDWAIGAPVDNRTDDMFSDDDFEDITGPACNSIYGLCE